MWSKEGPGQTGNYDQDLANEKKIINNSQHGACLVLQPPRPLRRALAACSSDGFSVYCEQTKTVGGVGMPVWGTTLVLSLPEVSSKSLVSASDRRHAS